MNAQVNPNGVLILGRNKIVVTMTPGDLAGTFDVEVDTSGFEHGVPLAVQCLFQAAMALIPVAYQTIATASSGGSM